MLHRKTSIRDANEREQQAASHPDQGCVNRNFIIRQTHRRPITVDFLDLKG